MLENPSASTSLIILDEYLGFTIHVEEWGVHVAEATFQRPGTPRLEAYGLPALRKRIWQWWHHVE